MENMNGLFKEKDMIWKLVEENSFYKFNINDFNRHVLLHFVFNITSNKQREVVIRNIEISIY